MQVFTAITFNMKLSIFSIFHDQIQYLMTFIYFWYILKLTSVAIVFLTTTETCCIKLDLYLDVTSAGLLQSGKWEVKMTFLFFVLTYLFFFHTFTSFVTHLHLLSHIYIFCHAFTTFTFIPVTAYYKQGLNGVIFLALLYKQNLHSKMYYLLS